LEGWDVFISLRIFSISGRCDSIWCIKAFRIARR
jgi:hypothetical protein